MKGKVNCTCGWSWNKSDSSKKDMYICHQCGRDNSNNMKNGGWLNDYNNISKAQEGEQISEPPKSQYKRLYGHANEYGVGENKNMRIDPNTGYGYFPSELSTVQQKEVPDSPWNVSRFLFDPFILNASQGIHNKKYDEKVNIIDIPGKDVIEEGYLLPIGSNRAERYNAAKNDITNYYKEDLKLTDNEVEKKVDDTMDLIRKMRRTEEMMQRQNETYKNFQNPEEVFKRAVGFYGDDNEINPSEAKRAYKMFQKTWRGTPGKEARQNAREELKKAEEAFKLSKKQMKEGLPKPNPNYVPEDFANGGILKNGGWLDNYGTQANYNDSKATASPDMIGEGFSNVGRNYSPAWGGQFQTGGSIPGAVGFTYARTKGIPSEGPYAKKTLPSAQNGQEMQYYQNGLDFKPKSISRDGAWLNKYDVAQNGYTTGDQVEYGTPEYTEAYNKGEVVTDEGVRSPIALDEVVIQNNYRKPRGFWEQYRDKIVDENKDAGPLGAIIGTPISAITSLPQLAATKLFSGNWNNEYYNMQRPSEAMDVENPYAAFAIDAVTDPANLIGAGVLTKENALAKLSNLRNINAEGKIFTGLNNELNNLAIQNTERYMAKRVLPDAPLVKELEPYISRIGEPIISREEEVFRNIMGPEYRAQKELENTKFFDPKGNIIDVPTSNYSPIKYFEGNYTDQPIKENNFGSIYTLNPLTLFGDDFNKPFLRKIGNSKGIKSLIENEAITSPGYSAPYFSPKTTWEGYNGTFAVGVDPKKVSPRFNKNVKSFDKFGNKTKGGLESLSMHNKSTGDLQRGYQSSWDEIPLEEGATSVFRRLPFTGAYKEIPLNAVLNPAERTFAQKIALNPHLADAQNIAEQALRYGIKLSVAQEIANSIFETKGDSTPFGNPIIPIKPIINKVSNDKKKQGGIIKDDRGQWAHPGEITEIGSNQITMQGVPYPVLGISDTGDTKLMLPNKNYKFKGKKVTEYPMAKNGINNLDARPLVKLDQLTNFTNYNKPQPGSGWLSKYN
jgi:hypothetical protein